MPSLQAVFRFFETRVDGHRLPADVDAGGGPPSGLWAFYWHFIRQSRGLYLALFGLGVVMALIDTLVPVFIGRLASLVAAEDRPAALAAALPALLAMAATVLLLRPVVMLLDSLVRHNAVLPGVTTLVRWQSHWHVVRQNWPFFQNDFAGRIANRVMNTANSLRESVVSSIRAVWYIAIYGASALVLMAMADPRLAGPTALWCVGYVLFLRHFVPRLKDLSRRSSEARSLVMGRVVDSYSNILTVKLFARAKDEDGYVREAIDGHQLAMSAHMRSTTAFLVTLASMNALLITSTAAIGVWLWSRGSVDPGAVAMAVPLAWQITSMAGWVSWEVSGIFENVGVVQEGLETIAVPHAMRDAPDARELRIDRGGIRFEDVRFAYDDTRPVLHGLTLSIRPGERVGLVGRSGAGKTTLVNLLLRFFDVGAGRILIDGQDVRAVTQESLRSAIGMVTQDTSLLHRSIADNIRYGRPQASDAEVRSAATTAHADGFIAELVDWKGRRGYDAHVGERGVKLSGGQRQRIALARVILKDAPILILDEATSALDSEIEGAIQEQLQGLMQDRTVIAIAHRLSTIARMDRLVVLDGGRIVEEGTHAELLARDGHYASLWRHQSGGFLGH